MGKVLESISEREAAFIARQKVFFVATAPLDGDHHVSVSPKAPGNSCVVLDERTVAYADLSGSGAETAAHVAQPGNGRMTLMFCNLEEGPPKILRLHGKAQLTLAEDVPAGIKARFPTRVTQSFGFRAVYTLHVERVSTSCGYSLPEMKFQKYRQILEQFTQKEGREGMVNYVTKKNSFSINGLPSLALWRRNAPKNVKPVEENGFIFGIVAESEDESNENTSAEDLARRSRSDRKRKGIELSLLQLVAMGASFLLLGFGIGKSTNSGSRAVGVKA